MCASLPKIEAKFETTLAAKLTAAGKSFTLTAHTDKNGAELTGLYAFLIDGENSSAEYIAGTVNAGTVTITLRGIDFSDGVTERAALKVEHVRGASVKLTDFPVIGQMRNKLAGTETLEALISYAADLTPTDDQNLATKKYCDDTFVPDTGDTTIAGEKTFSTFPITPSAAPDADYEVANKKYCDDTFVADTGDQTIAGVKTFSSSPIVPTPTTDMQAATKKYMDDAIIAGGVPATEAIRGIAKLNVAATDPTDPIALGANDVAETGASKVLRLKSDGKIDTTVIPDASTTVAGKVKLNVAPASATEPIALGSNDVAETGNSKVVRLKSNGKLNTTVLPVLTKGNVMVAGGANYDTALAVGNDDTVLTADSGETLGVKWADPLTNIKKYLTHKFVAYQFGLHANQEETDEIRVYAYSDQISEYSDIVLLHCDMTSGYTLEIKYLKRDTTLGTPYAVTEDWTNVSNATLNAKDYSAIILGNYVYVFYTIDGPTNKCSRYDKTTLANAADITIGAGGNTIDADDWAVVTDGTYIYIATKTKDHWNKYTVNGTTLDYTADITMDTECAQTAAWQYESDTTSWVGLIAKSGGEPHLFYRITLGSAASATNTAYIPFNNSDVTTVGPTRWVSLLKREDGIYEMAISSTYALTTDVCQADIDFVPIVIPTLS